MNLPNYVSYIYFIFLCNVIYIVCEAYSRNISVLVFEYESVKHLFVSRKSLQ